MKHRLILSLCLSAVSVKALAYGRRAVPTAPIQAKFGLAAGIPVLTKVAAMPIASAVVAPAVFAPLDFQARPAVLETGAIAASLVPGEADAQIRPAISDAEVIAAAVVPGETDAQIRPAISDAEVIAAAVAPGEGDAQALAGVYDGAWTRWTGSAWSMVAFQAGPGAHYTRNQLAKDLNEAVVLGKHTQVQGSSYRVSPGRNHNWTIIWHWNEKSRAATGVAAVLGYFKNPTIELLRDAVERATNGYYKLPDEPGAPQPADAPSKDVPTPASAALVAENAVRAAARPLNALLFFNIAAFVAAFTSVVAPGAGLLIGGLAAGGVLMMFIVRNAVLNAYARVFWLFETRRFDEGARQAAAKLRSRAAYAAPIGIVVAAATAAAAASPALPLPLLIAAVGIAAALAFYASVVAVRAISASRALLASIEARLDPNP